MTLLRFPKRRWRAALQGASRFRLCALCVLLFISTACGPSRAVREFRREIAGIKVAAMGHNKEGMASAFREAVVTWTANPVELKQYGDDLVGFGKAITYCDRHAAKDVEWQAIAYECDKVLERK